MPFSSVTYCRVVCSVVKLGTAKKQGLTALLLCCAARWSYVKLSAVKLSCVLHCIAKFGVVACGLVLKERSSERLLSFLILYSAVMCSMVK